jgi:uncharacterized repeat protein (TIGR03833 family)
MTKKNIAPPKTDPGSLTHNPFAGLASKQEIATRPVTPGSSPMVRREPPAKPLPPCKLSLRHETAGRSGKVVTRIKGLPIENLEAIAARLRKALGCGATVDCNDLLLLGSLAERASQWLEGAGDLRKIVMEPVAAASTQSSGPAVHETARSAGRQSSGTIRSDIRPGLRVAIVMKADQLSGTLTEGVVCELLTNSATHPRGIKVRLESGEVGRVRLVRG